MYMYTHAVMPRPAFDNPVTFTAGRLDIENILWPFGYKEHIQLKNIFNLDIKNIFN